MLDTDTETLSSLDFGERKQTKSYHLSKLFYQMKYCRRGIFLYKINFVGFFVILHLFPNMEITPWHMKAY